MPPVDFMLAIRLFGLLYIPHALGLFSLPADSKTSSQMVEYPSAGSNMEMERRADGECETPITKDVECKEAVFALQDIKNNLIRQHPDIYLEISNTWEYDGSGHPFLDAAMFFDKSLCVDPEDKDCMYEPRIENSKDYWAIVDMQCSDLHPEARKESQRCKNMIGQDKNKHKIARELIAKSFPALPAAYRLMETVFMGMTRNGEVKHQIPLNCYTKLLFAQLDVPFKTKVSIMSPSGKCELGTSEDMFKMLILDPSKLYIVPGEEKLMEGFHPELGQAVDPGGVKPSAPGGALGAVGQKPSGNADTTGANEYPSVAKLPLYLPRKRCEICVTVMMRKIAQAAHLCSGLEFYFETCNDVLASILHWYPNVIYWSYTGGCDKVNKWGGTRRVRPCPPHAICSWLTSPNYNVPFCPWDGDYKAPGLEDSLQADNGMDAPSDNLPPNGGNMGAPIAPMMGMIG